MCKIEDAFVLILLLLCSISDIRRRGVYTWVLLGLSMLLLVFRLMYCPANLWSILGGLAIGLLFLFISKLSKEAIGYADSWLILLLGGYLGFRGTMLLLTGAFVITGIFGLAGMALRRLKKKSRIPFIPFLTIAYMGVALL